MANPTNTARVDYKNTAETMGFRLGSALRAGELPAFIGGLYPRELSELTAAAPALRTMVSETTGREIVYALSARAERFDAAASSTARPAWARKYRACGDAAEKCQIAWHQANMATLREARVAA